MGVGGALFGDTYPCSPGPYPFWAILVQNSHSGPFWAILGQNHPLSAIVGHSAAEPGIGQNSHFGPKQPNFTNLADFWPF